jgi:glycosyltransferase involved in cell wall biosynthesis
MRPVEIATTPMMSVGLGVRQERVRGAGESGVALAKDRPVKILIVTDAWSPQVNGVVRTLESLSRELVAMGHRLRCVTPENHASVPLPTYPQIRLALFPRHRIQRAIDEFVPDAIHIATEGTMGLSARAISLERKYRFTTAFHTRFPDYVHARFPFIPESAVFGALKTFHAPAAATMVSTASLKRELETHGFSNVQLWSRGVDIDRFHPCPHCTLERYCADVARPIFLYAGRLAVEKNVEAFLSLDLPGTKLVAGEGPQRAELQARFPAARFLGQIAGEDLARLYTASDVFVFPSRTDTFGLVLLEALACGTPVAAYPVQAPLDLLGGHEVAVLDEDLRAACLKARSIPRDACRAFAMARSWRASAEQFLGNLVAAGA